MFWITAVCVASINQFISFSVILFQQCQCPNKVLHFTSILVLALAHYIAILAYNSCSYIYYINYMYYRHCIYIIYTYIHIYIYKYIYIYLYINIHIYIQYIYIHISISQYYYMYYNIYYDLLLKFKVSVIWLFKTVCIFQMLLIDTVQISMESER